MRLAVVGDPVAHSRSPAIHTAALRAAGITGTYTARRVDAAGMADVTDRLRRGGLDGINVTMPHKAVAAGLVDRVAGVAARTGVVNTVTRVGDRLFGHNTDVPGMAAAWAAAGLPVDLPVLLLGSGGAAAAALVALEMLGTGPVFVAGRSADRAADLVAGIGSPARHGTIDEADAGGAVVVNATPLGMGGEPLPVDLDGADGLFDMAYGDTTTPAVASMRRRGVPVGDGLAMLVHQAAESFRLWTGRPADLDAMTAAATGRAGPVPPGGER